MAALKPFTRFLLVGGLGFLIDAGVTQTFIHLGASPLWSRVPAIVAAMAFTWQCNRPWTYRVAQKAGWHEAGRYLGVACAVALINYGLYSFLVLAGFPAFISIAMATALQTVIGFLGYRRFAFRDPAA